MMRPGRAVRVVASGAALVGATTVAGAQQSGGPPVSAGALGTVRGVGYDSFTRGPVAGAAVQIVRASDLLGGRSVVADSAGGFRIDSLAAGRYLVGLEHPLLDLLHVEVQPRLVELAPPQFNSAQANGRSLVRVWSR